MHCGTSMTDVKDLIARLMRRSSSLEGKGVCSISSSGQDVATDAVWDLSDGLGFLQAK